jgi:putative endonuclease
VAAWSLYLVRTRQGALYAGVATDVARRMKEHAGAGGRGAKYLRSRGPLQLAYRVELGDRALALRAEARLKRLAKAVKEEIVASAPGARELLARLLPEDSAEGAHGSPLRRGSSCP